MRGCAVQLKQLRLELTAACRNSIPSTGMIAWPRSRASLANASAKQPRAATISTTLAITLNNFQDFAIHSKNYVVAVLW